jgi:hypothetical protein
MLHVTSFDFEDISEAQLNQIAVMDGPYQAAIGKSASNVWDHWTFEVAGKLYRIGFCSYDDAAAEAKMIAVHRHTDHVIVVR